MNWKNIISCLLVFLLSLSIIPSPALSITLEWYDPCDEYSHWSMSGISTKKEVKDVKEGDKCVKITYDGSPSLAYLNISIPSHDPMPYACIGFWLKIVQWDIGTVTDGSGLEIGVLATGQSNRIGLNHVDYDAWIIFWQHFGSGSKYHLSGSVWIWWELNQSETDTCSKWAYNWYEDEGHGFAGHSPLPDLYQFRMIFNSWGSGKTIILLLDYVRLSDLSEYPPSDPPYPEDVPIRDPPYEYYIPMGMGMFGLCFLILLPTLLVMMWRKRKGHWIPYLFIMFWIAIGLVVAWLWG